MLLLAQSTETGNEGDLVSNVGSEIRVALDRWSTGQIGLSDAVLAGALMVAAAIGAWLVRRLTSRWAKSLEGPAATAGLVVGQLISVGIYLLAVALALEVLGFGLGPLLIIILVVAVAVMLIGPLMKNLSSGLLLQLRGAFTPGDVVETNGTTGVVEEVNTRTVVVVTSDGKKVHIPCRDVLEHVLINYSTTGRRRSRITLRLPLPSDIPAATLRLNEALSSIDDILDEPPPEVVTTGFDGTKVLVDVLFWHGPELWAERVARDRVGRVVIELLEASDLALADVTLAVTTARPVESG